MITVLTGENSFEISQAYRRLAADFDGSVERVDGTELELRQLPDLLMGATLFANKRLVVVRSLGDNKAIWTDFADWLEKVSDDVHLVIIESKLDKRTRTYKELKKQATIQEFPLWSEQDVHRAESWVANEVKRREMVMDKKSIQLFVARVGLDQWQLTHGLEKLSVLDAITPEIVTSTIDARPSESVFNVFEAALAGKSNDVATMLRTLALTEDAYMLFGLLSGQAFQLAALALSDEPQAIVAKAIGAHPFALGKLAPYARTLDQAKARMVIAIFAEADTAMKTSGGEPWLLIERALAKVTRTVAV